MRTLTATFALLVAAACGSDSNPVAAACGKILDAECAKFVECHVVQGGVQFTANTCAQVRAQAIAQCESKEGGNLRAASDSEVNQCASEASAVGCGDICNKVPSDTPTCHKISPSPNTEMITCAP